jgi:ABC-type multidrug transport system ATPase subunit
VLEVESLGKRYGDRWIFRDLNFSVETGQCLLIAGQNGSGKSTLVRTLAGLNPPSHGRVSFDGERRREVGYMALESQPYTNLTPLEHLQLFARMQGTKARPEVLDEVGLTALIKGKITAGQMSSGMKARLKLALAIQSEPRLLILDEPGTALDEAGRRVLRQVREAQLKRGAIIIATNDPTEREGATHELWLGD